MKIKQKFIKCVNLACHYQASVESMSCPMHLAAQDMLSLLKRLEGLIDGVLVQLPKTFTDDLAETLRNAQRTPDKF